MKLPRTMSSTVALAALAAVVAGCPKSTDSEPPNETEPEEQAEAEPADDDEDEGEPAQLALEIREWPVPWEDSRPRDPYVAPDGTIWFVGQKGDYLGHLDPETDELRKLDLPEGTGPHNVIVDEEGHPWYAGNLDRHIGRVDPESGEITRFDMPERVKDPHTMAWASDGSIWFTAQRSPPAGYVGRFSPETGETEVVDIPGEAMRPYGLVVSADDRPYVAFMGKNAIGTVDPETMKLEIIETPDPRTRTRRLGITSDGRVWWVDAAAGFIGVYDPESEQMSQWQTPGGEKAALYAVAIDGEDRLWYVETGLEPNRIIGFDTEAEQFVSANEIPSGGGKVRHMVFHPPTSSIWFGTDTHTIGRATVP